MKLGAFSISLTVKDIHKSFAFYEKLGFRKMGGDINQNWIIIRNEDTVIGLFQGMFEKNILTFNPGWNQTAENLEEFQDIREIEKQLVKQEVPLIKKTERTSGPDHIVLEDPDGNMIMLDQHRE
jgi:catechol 2,3-dioxygenase-like lactoylglutathione lyase family enzyme